MSPHPFKTSLIFGIPMLIVAGVLQWINPSAAGSLPEGFNTPIIALEFIRSGEEIRAFFNAANANQLRNDFLLGNSIDYLFMFFYSAFLGFTGMGIIRETGEKILWSAVVLCVIIFFSDLLENVTIASLIDVHFDGGELTGSYFGNLHFFTWLKWGGIAAVLLIYGAWFFRRNILGKVIAAVALAAFVSAVVAFFDRGVANEVMGMTVVFGFLLLFIHNTAFAIRGRLL